MNYSLNKNVKLSFDETIQKLTEELKKEGFGILTQIDVQETLKKKINEDFRPYVILGACNPQFAFKVLNMDDKIGVFLPCNVVVQQHEDGQVEISIGDPEEMMKSASTDALQTFAQVVKSSMQRVLANVYRKIIRSSTSHEGSCDGLHFQTCCMPLFWRSIKDLSINWKKKSILPYVLGT